MTTFTFNVAGGLVAGFEYHVKSKAHTYISDYFPSLHPPSWGASATFYSSILPLAPAAPSVSAPPTKTDVTITWSLFSTPAEKGYSTTDPVYWLQMDLCGRAGNQSDQWITL